MIASLPMYDLAPIKKITDAWWHGLAAHLRAAGVSPVPATLTRKRDLRAVWRSPKLLLGQTCGYPLTHELTHALADRPVRLVATPHYKAPGCDGARYASALLVSAHDNAEKLTDLAGGIAVINSLDSQSGYHVLRYMTAIAAPGAHFFRQINISGAHVASIHAVASRRADIAAVDAVTHALLMRHAPVLLTGTRVLAFSPSAPGLPYITNGALPDDALRRLRAGLQAAFADPALATIRADLLLEAIDFLTMADYRAITDMEQYADDAGTPRWQST